MKAVVYEKYGPPEVLRVAEVEKPVPKDDEVLIRIRATAATVGDCNVRGFTFVPPGFKFIARLMFGLNKPKKPVIGVVFAGEVEETGRAVTLFKKGDAVYGIDGLKMGAYAQYKCLSEKGAVAAKPKNATFEEAAAIPFGALTAWSFLKEKVGVHAGQKVLVNGASGGVGNYAVQIAKYLGAEVTGVCSTGSMDFVRSLGADHVLDHTAPGFTLGNEEFDIVLNTVAAEPSFARYAGSLKPNGLYLAVAGGLKEMLQSLLPSMGGGRKVIAVFSSEKKESLEALTRLVDEGKLRPTIDRVFPLDEIVAAHRHVETAHKKGCVVISVQ
ncbi:MAG TPA: NAD(P)-dependent alcohol dehydrogenase [bacterium]|nr:NAD(P)-dependent alcohol dehydrogenase [bacterium]